jgi:Meiotically up-regulated gene 113
MLLNTDAMMSPRIGALTDHECWQWLTAMGYCSHWNVPRLSRRLQQSIGITPKLARRLAEVGLATLEEDGELVWDCSDLVRFTPRPGRGQVARAPDRRGPGFTYLIQAGEGGDVKIGSTYQAPERRLRALQTGSPVPLRLVKVLEGAHLEVQLHARYAPFRTRGEWFDAQILADLL